MQRLDKHAGLFGVLLAAIFLIHPARAVTQVKPPTAEDQKHYMWLSGKLDEVYSIRPGMTKADLLKVFTEDGGLKRIQPQRFVLRSCHLIKVEVVYDVPQGTPASALPPDNELKIKAISKPYLEPMIMD
ncbi:MAG: hypothetical protein ACE145_08395 [Terriglobia bacterium]